MIFESAGPVMDVATDAGPSAIMVGLLLYLARGVPRFLDACTKTLENASVLLTRLSRVALLSEKWLDQNTSGSIHESNEHQVIREVLDGATDEQVLSMLDELDIGDTSKINLKRYGRRMQDIVELVRKREKSGPRRSA